MPKCMGFVWNQIEEATLAMIGFGYDTTTENEWFLPQDALDIY